MNLFSFIIIIIIIIIYFQYLDFIYYMIEMY